MIIKKLSDKILVGGTVTIATLGCTTCDDNGAVDPLPPPFRCSEVATGQQLSVTGALADTVLTTVINNTASTRWDAVPQITGLTGFKLEDVSWQGGSAPVIVTLKLDSASVTSGEFTLRGTLVAYTDGTKCAVERTFTVTISGGNVDIARRDTYLPLGNRGAAVIELVRREALEVELRAVQQQEGWVLSWSVTGGSFEPTTGRDGIVWRLPSEPGLYQAELLTDHGREGLAVDTLVLEVS